MGKYYEKIQELLQRLELWDLLHVELKLEAYKDDDKRLIELSQSIFFLETRVSKQNLSLVVSTLIDHITHLKSLTSALFEEAVNNRLPDTICYLVQAPEIGWNISKAITIWCKSSLSTEYLSPFLKSLINILLNQANPTYLNNLCTAITELKCNSYRIFLLQQHYEELQQKIIDNQNIAERLVEMFVICSQANIPFTSNNIDVVIRILRKQKNIHKLFSFIVHCKQLHTKQLFTVKTLQFLEFATNKSTDEQHIDPSVYSDMLDQLATLKLITSEQDIDVMQKEMENIQPVFLVPLLTFYLHKLPNQDIFKAYIMQILTWYKGIDLNKIPTKCAEKIEQVLTHTYKQYLTLCDVISEKKMNFIRKSNSGHHINFNHFSYDITQCYIAAYVEPYNLSDVFKSELQKLDFPCWLSFRSDNLLSSLIPPNPRLHMKVANTITEYAIRLIDDKIADVNEYSLEYGNTPLILAVCKGWNHIDPDSSYKETDVSEKSMQPIIESLLQCSHLDINAIHLVNGMTALHVACLRGDSPEFITKLLQHPTIDVHAEDYAGKKPIDLLLNTTYEQVQHIICSLTGGSHYLFGKHGNETCPEHQSFVATLPTREERSINVIKIKHILDQYTSSFATG